MDSDGIKHFGIKGMKWGIRRFQNEDGSLTPAGRERYGAAGIAIGTYALKKGGRAIDARITRVLSKDIPLKRMAYANEPLRDAFFAAYKPRDINKYRGLYGGQLRQNRFARQLAFDPTAPTGEIQRTMTLVRDARIASRKTARDTINNVLKDPKNRSEIEKIIKDSQVFNFTDRQRNKLLKEISSGKLSMNGYELFNRNLLGQAHENPVVKNFYEQLKKQGYDAIQDVNDKYYSGYHGQNPLIVFNRDIIKSSTDKAIDSDAIIDLYNKEIGKLSMENVIRQIPDMTWQSLAYGGAGGLAGLAISDSAKKKQQENNKRK